MAESNEIKSIDIGVSIGGAKSNYLANHYSMVQRETDMIASQAEVLNVKRYRGLVEHHIAQIANEHKQNELRKILDEKFEEECKQMADKQRISPDELSSEDIDSAMLSACACVIGLITVYMDQFTSIEEKYEVMLL